jgi:hypothetical protein
MHTSLLRGLLPATVVLLALSAAACDTPVTDVDISEPSLASVHATTAQDDLLKAVRQATARYHSPQQAVAAGYEPTDHCVPEMGYHWANPAAVDPVFDLRQPEVMLYETGPRGQPRLVAVEYVVIDVGQDHPHFGDHPFDVGGTPVPVDHWSLHVWLYKDNPDGVFTAFNPTVSCD